MDRAAGGGSVGSHCSLSSVLIMGLEKDKKERRKRIKTVFISCSWLQHELEGGSSRFGADKGIKEGK